ncbi:MAG: cytochrome P450 [Nocardioidaceae bacterium]
MRTSARVGFPVGEATTVAELEGDPHPRLAELRQTEPVSWVPALNGWLVTRHDLASVVLRAPGAFTVDDPRFSTARVLGPSMLSLDGSDHSRHRDAFARAFRPEETHRRFAEAVESEAHRLVAAMRPQRRAELRTALAGPLAASVLTTALGLADAEVVTVRRWYDAFVAAVSAITAGERPSGTAEDALAELRDAVQGQLGDPREESLLAGALREPGALSTTEIVSNAAVLMFGGIDTAEGMVANAVLHLLSHPDQSALVRGDPSLLDAAVEESARLEPAAAMVDRYATGDTDLGGVHIRAGDPVTVSLAGANRDPDVFTDPDSFDVRRANLGRHLAFARGPHFCFGAHLARLETRTAVRELLAQLPALVLDSAHTDPPQGLVFRKPPRVSVRWDTQS